MYRFGLLCIAFALAPLLTVTASADGDPEAGKAKAAVCAACHGIDGNSINPEWPSLAGQIPSYTVRQLAAFKSGERVNVLMTAQAINLSEQDMEDLAAFYAAQPRKAGEADPDLVDLGAAIYRAGNRDTGVAACASCHGPNGRGNALAGIPALAGQRDVYVAKQLKDYASGDRAAGLYQMMGSVSDRLNADEAAAVASYVQGLN